MTFFQNLKTPQKILLLTVSFLLSVVFIMLLVTYFNFTYIEAIKTIGLRFILILTFFLISGYIGNFPIMLEIKNEFLLLDNLAISYGFPSFFRKYHMVFLFFAAVSYFIIPTFETNSTSQYVCLLVSFVFIILFFIQFFVHIFFYVKHINKEQKNKNIRQFSTVIPVVKQVAVVCAECLKVGGGIILAGEIGYKVFAGGPNAVSPPRKFVLNTMFPDDRTKIWSESKAALALHNKAMGLPHDNIYGLQDFVKGLQNSKK
jgi:hypothetical protein